MTRKKATRQKEPGSTANEVKEELAEAGAHAKAAAKKTKEVVQEAGRDVYASGREQVQSAQGALETYVKDQPIKTVLIAAGVGLLLGSILARR